MKHVVQQAVYIDSPVINALQQVFPFHRTGIFSKTDTPILLKVRPSIVAQLPFIKPPETVDIRYTRRSNGHGFPVEDGGVVFYPFNSQSNINAVTNRRLTHVSILHGESNKDASARPAARLYDYICIAGPLAKERYVSQGLFTNTEAEEGRLIMMGDSFVQEIPWITPAKEDTDDGSLLYCPTWEGYGNATNNHTSVTNQQGFHAACDIAAELGMDQIIIKPHPYLGLLTYSLIPAFIKGVRIVQRRGFTVRLALQEANAPLKVAIRVALPLIKRQSEALVQPIRMGLCDLSGMEAVFLKQGIAHLVLVNDTRNQYPVLDEIYDKKGIYPKDTPAEKAARYIGTAKETDACHRKAIFGWQEPEVGNMTNLQKNEWLIQYLAQNPYWAAGR